METKITTHTRKGKLVHEITVNPEEFTLKALKTSVSKKMKLNTNRLYITINDPNVVKKVALKKDQLTFAQMGLSENNVNLLVKDLG